MAAQVTLVANPHITAVGDKYRATGDLVLANPYVAGGSSVDPINLGLATVEALYLQIPHLLTGLALTVIFWPVVRTRLPVRTGIYNKAGFTIFDTTGIALLTLTALNSNLLTATIGAGTISGLKLTIVNAVPTTTVYDNLASGTAFAAAAAAAVNADPARIATAQVNSANTTGSPPSTGDWSSLIRIQAFDNNNTESSGDLSTFAIPYEAVGVGG